jgi:WD40 repeat protein
MSPEQAAAKSMGIDHRTDVFSLGSTLYEALTLTRAFDGDTSQLVFRKILTADPPDPRSIRSRVPRDLAVICLKTLEKDPGRRYAGAGEFAADLRRFVGDQLIRARPPGPIARSAKWCRRHQALAASGGVFALAFASVTGLLFENRAARRRIERAQEETQAALEAKGEALAARTRALERADSRRLLAESAAALIYDPAMALVLAIEAARREPGLAANNALLDAMNANYELRTLQGHEGVVYTARFSPDGAQVVTASRDGTARLWDVPTGECTLTIRPGKVALLSANFDPSGRRLVTASEDETARVWSLPKGEEMLVLGGHAKEVTDARFDWEGRRIVTTSLDGGARVWAADTGELRLSLEPQEANDRPGMLSGRFDGSGRRIVTAGMDGVARIWDAATGEQRLELKGQGGPVTSASFSPDGLRVLTASVDYSASIWNAETGALIGTPLRHSGSVYSAEFALDGKRVVTASGFNDFYGVGRPMAQIWDAHTGELLGSLRGHNATVLSAGFSPSGRRVVTGSEDGTVRLWDSDYRLQSGALVLPVPLRVRTAEFSADGKRLFVVGWDEDGVGRVKLLQLEDFAEVRSMGRPEQPILCAALSHDGRRVVLGSPTGTASVRDLGTLRELAVLRGHQSEVLHAVFAPDGSLIATAGSYDKTVRIWSAEDGALLRTLHGHEGQVVCVSFSPDGKKLLSASGQDKTTRVWSVDSGEALHVLPWKDWEGLFTWPVAIVHARFSPDGQRIVVAEGAKVARVWELASEQILATLEGHQSWVLSACFSPDGSRVATASGDGTARLWDWRTGTLIQVMRGHGGALSDVRFSPDGRWILTTSFWDTSVRRWPVDPLDLALASQPRVLTDEELRRYGVGVDEKRPVDAESSSSLCEAEEPLDAR